MTSAFAEYFRCADETVELVHPVPASGGEGFFRFGTDGAGYAAAPGATASFEDSTPDLISECAVESASVRIPFDMQRAVADLREERYLREGERGVSGGLVRKAYYAVRPLMPVAVRKHLQRRALRNWDSIPFPRWPVDVSVDAMMREFMGLAVRARGGEAVPFVWFWPEGREAACMMTHDVETAAGRDFCSTLMDITAEFGFRSSFQAVPEVRYEVPESFRGEIVERRFELNLHGLNHDGHLFRDYAEFSRRIVRIGEYARAWGARGFRSPVLYRNADWMAELPFEYDMSYPNVAHLDPQRGGCCTVMPYFFGNVAELPLTATQDYTLFNIFQDYSLGLWERQIERIVEFNGLVSFIVHPDYVIDPKPRDTYRRLLARLREIADSRGVWCAKPGDIADWWRERAAMRVERAGGGDWRVAGKGSERARVALARMDARRLQFEIVGRR